jgi:epoxyqueuosine reductase
MVMVDEPVNRRDFLKMLGAVGLSGSIYSINNVANYPASPILNQEVDAAGRSPKPAWIHRTSQPTCEIDWSRVQRFDARNAISASGINFPQFVGRERSDYLVAKKAENEIKRILANTPGYTLEDYALHSALRSQLNSERSFLGPRITLVPQDRGVPRWEGSPEDAARILRVAMRHFGAAEVGFLELNEDVKRLIYAYDPDGKELIFEEVSEAYETEEKRVIPASAKWVIVYAVQMSGDTVRCSPTITASQTSILSYRRGAFIQENTQELLRGLGYQGLGQATMNALGLSVAFGVLAGLGELSRQNRLISPKYGPMVRLFIMLTDLPVMTDTPIDAGILQFCKTCKKCAEVCPADALSHDDEPTWSPKGSWNNAGHKAYFEDSVKCFSYWQEHAGSDCSICFAVCPFANKDKAWVHTLAKSSISIFPATDGFLRTMDDAFSYGAQEDPGRWWYLDLPEYGIEPVTAK